MKKSIFAIILIVGIVIYGGYDYFKNSAKSLEHVVGQWDDTLEIGIAKGQRAPDFVLQDLAGEPVQLSDFAGKKIFLNFWASWCPPCQAEMPHMQKFYEDYGDKDAVIVGVNLTPTEKREDDVYNFVEAEGITFPIVFDPDGEIMVGYRVMAYPTTFLIDSTGIIREIFKGPLSYDMLKKAARGIN